MQAAKQAAKQAVKQQSRHLSRSHCRRSHMTRPAHTRNRAPSPACASSMVGRERSVRQLAAWTGGLFWFVHGLTNPSGHPTPFDPRLPPSSIPFLSTAPPCSVLVSTCTLPPHFGSGCLCRVVGKLIPDRVVVRFFFILVWGSRGEA